MLFIATTAEEKGLVGADYFVSKPTVPVERLVGVINLDGAMPFYPLVDVIGYGAGAPRWAAHSRSCRQPEHYRLAGSRAGATVLHAIRSLPVRSPRHPGDFSHRGQRSDAGRQERSRDQRTLVAAASASAVGRSQPAIRLWAHGAVGRAVPPLDGARGECRPASSLVRKRLLR